jgi:8-oxo-dGTP diphosphatase
MDTNLCVGAFIVEKDKFLLGKRTNAKTWYAGVWDIFGGHALADESSPEVLKRELNEELGIVPTTYELFRSVEVFEEEKPIEYHIYIVTTWSGIPTNCCKEHSEIKWFSVNELREIQLASEKYLDLVDEWLRRNE